MITPAYSPTATERVLPRMALDFTTALLDSRVTVTRALNTATRINSSGLVETVNADLPRFDYDPATLACKGLLVEETRVNYLLYSQDFTQANWQKIAAGTGILPVVTPNFAAAPDGTTTATRLQLDAGGNTSSDYSVLRQPTLGLAAPISRSIWIKSNTGTTQTVALVATNPATKIAVTPQWQRLSDGQTSSGVNQFDISVGGAGATPATADVLVWGAQLEAGAFATSYIPTTTTSLTRNADVVSMTGTNFSDWYNASEGSFEAVYSSFAVVSSSVKAVVATNDGTTSNRVYTYLSATARPTMLVTTTGSTQVSMTNDVVAASTRTNTVMTYKLDSFALATNGGTVATDALGSIPTVNKLEIGCFSGASNLNGYMEKLFYWPQRILNAETQAFSK